MKLFASRAAIALALCVLFTSSAAKSKNLYLYAEYGQYAQGGVLRFPIVNGVAEKKSDFKYDCQEFMCGGLQLAVAPDGTLYYSNGLVYAFMPGKHAPTRRIIVPFPSSCYGAPGSYGVAVNADRFLAVGGLRSTPALRPSRRTPRWRGAR